MVVADSLDDDSEDRPIAFAATAALLLLLLVLT